MGRRVICVVLGVLVGGCGSEGAGSDDATSMPDDATGDPPPSSSSADPSGSSATTAMPPGTGDATSGDSTTGGSDGGDTSSESSGGATGEPDEAVLRGLIAQYTFEGDGTQVVDGSGFGEPLDLTMYREAFIERVPHGVRFLPTPDVGEITGPDYTTPIIRSLGAADKINDAVIASDAFTLEVWLDPTDLDQSGPGRVVSIDYTNYDSTNFNAMHGPPNCGDHGVGAFFQFRMGGTGNACPALPVPAAPNVTGDLQHLVLTQDGTTWALYLDGEESIAGEHADTPSGWNTIAGLAFGNLPSLPDEGASDGNFRGWVGDLYYVGWHDVALTPAEVATNFAIPHADR